MPSDIARAETGEGDGGAVGGGGKRIVRAMRRPFERIVNGGPAALVTGDGISSGGMLDPIVGQDELRGMIGVLGAGEGGWG